MKETSADLPATLADRGNLMVGDQTYLQKLRAGALSEDQWNALEAYFGDNAAGPIQPSIICKSKECPYYNACPLVRAEVELPVGDPCVVEETVKRNWASLYYPEIGKAKDGYAAVDRGVVIDLINTMMDIKRAQEEAVDQPQVVERVLRGFDKDNNAIIELRMNPLHFYLKNARLLKQKILHNLVATREARAKDKSRQTESTAHLMTEMRESLDMLHNIQKSQVLEEGAETIVSILDEVEAKEAEFAEKEPTE